jgi:GntR family transcriptional regulator/MocR family aminotransferase
MRNWLLTVPLDRRHEKPLYLQLADAVSDDIRRGRLKPGEPLPGTRELADSLGLNRNTIVAGYAELFAEGLIESHPRGGTFVAPKQASVAGFPHASRDTPTYALQPCAAVPSSPLVKPGMLTLAYGWPDLRLMPSRALARAFRRAVSPRARTLLTQSEIGGHRRLREELAKMLSRTRGLVTTAQDIVITRGIEQGIDLVTRTLIRPGDAVVVEAYGYPPAWRSLKNAGAQLFPLPVDAGGLDIDALETLLATRPIRAVFITPHHQFPTTSVMSPQRRERLAQLALQHRFAIMEDDYDYELHYDGDPVLPIAAGSGRSNVIYIGTLSILLAPTVSVGFVVAPPVVRDHLINLRAYCDRQGDAAIECAIAELFEDGELLRHVRRMRRAYTTRRDAFVRALQRHLHAILSFDVPHGGLAVWARVDDAIDVAHWREACEREGVLIGDARSFDYEAKDASHLRLAFGFHNVDELEEAVRRMARALPTHRADAAKRRRNASGGLSNIAYGSNPSPNRRSGTGVYT